MPGKIVPLNVETVITYTFQNIRVKNVAVKLAMMITGIYKLNIGWCKMCRICGNERFTTKDCCPTPMESKNCISRDDFEKLMYKVWGDHGVIPSVIVRDFYSDWINGQDISAEEYLKHTSD
jgi:hypothetical protein